VASEENNNWPKPAESFRTSRGQSQYTQHTHQRMLEVQVLLLQKMTSFTYSHHKPQLVRVKILNNKTVAIFHFLSGSLISTFLSLHLDIVMSTFRQLVKTLVVRPQCILATSHHLCTGYTCFYLCTYTGENVSIPSNRRGLLFYLL